MSEVNDCLKDMSDFSKDHERLLSIFFCYSGIVQRCITKHLKATDRYREESFRRCPLVKLFSNWLTLLHPCIKYSRIARQMTPVLQALFHTLRRKISELKLEVPIMPDHSGFRMVFVLFYHVYLLYLKAVSTLLDGGHELSDTKRYAWLVKATIEAKVTYEQIDTLSATFFTDAEDSSYSKHLLTRGLSFRMEAKSPLRPLQEHTFMKQCVAEQESPTIGRLLAHMYTAVPNRFNKRLTAEHMHFERVVFAAFMKQLGFVTEVWSFCTAVDRGEAPVVTHYMKLVMEALYRIRGMMSLSKQETSQFRERRERDASSNEMPGSLRENYPAYRDEVLKKDIYLLHIQPCLRFSNQDYEKAFSVYLKHLERFMVSATCIKDYFQLIEASEEAKNGVCRGLMLVKEVLASARAECRTFAIDMLASRARFLSFLLGLSGDSSEDDAGTYQTTISGLLKSLVDKMVPGENVSAQIVFFLDLVMAAKEMNLAEALHPLSRLWERLDQIKPHITQPQWRSYRVFVAAAMYVMYEQQPEIASHDAFATLVAKIMPSGELCEGDLALARYGMRMEMKVRYRVADLVQMMLKCSPRYYRPICELIYDTIASSAEGSPEDLVMLLDHVSQVAAGGRSQLLGGAGSYVTANFGSDGPSSCQTPSVLLSGCCALIHVFRKLLQDNHAGVLELFNRVIDAVEGSVNAEMGSAERLKKPALMFGVFAVLSNTIQVLSDGSLVKDEGGNSMIFVTEIDEEAGHVLGWSLPITTSSVKCPVRLDRTLSPIPTVAFTHEMFPVSSALMSVFMAHLSKPQRNILFEYLSFYVLASLREFCKDPRFLMELITALPKPSVIHRFLGSSDGDFMRILHCHLRLGEGGFVRRARDTTGTFFVWSPADYIADNYRVTRSSLTCLSGMACFVTDSLGRDSPSVMVITPAPGALFDVGFVVLSPHQNSEKALMLLAHDGDPVIVGGHPKPLKHVPERIRLEFAPSTGQATISDAATEQQLAKIFVMSQLVVFLVVLYRESKVEYSVMKPTSGVRPSTGRCASAVGVANAKLVPPTDKGRMDALSEGEMFRFSSADAPLIKYPRSVLNRIEPSKQTITQRMDVPEPPQIASVAFNEMTFLGFRIPRGVLFMSKAIEGLFHVHCQKRGFLSFARARAVSTERRSFRVKCRTTFSPFISILSEFCQHA